VGAPWRRNAFPVFWLALVLAAPLVSP
jgi:hypothetical protein